MPKFLQVQAFLRIKLDDTDSTFQLKEATSKSLSIVILSLVCTSQQTLDRTLNKLKIYGTFEHAHEKNINKTEMIALN